MLKYLFDRPLLLCGIVCAVVAFLGYYSLYFSIAAGLCAVILCLMIIKFKKHTAYILCCMLVCALSITSFFGFFRAERYKIFVETETIATLTLCELVENSGYYSGVFQTRACNEIENGIKLYAFFEPCNVEVGDVITAKLRAYATDEKYRLSNFSEGVYLTANIYAIDKTGETDPVIKSVETVKSYIKTTLFSNLERKEAATVSALLFGEKDYFDESYETAVKRAGVSHVMVVSGMHLSISVLFFVGVLSRIWYNRYVKAITMLAVVLVLTSVCGFSISILRAGVTYIIAAILLILNRNSTSENNLGGAVAIILIFNPLTVFSGAFWLSVLSTFGILCVAKYVLGYLERTSLYRKPILYEIVSAVIITLSATLLTLPVTIYLFGEVSLVGVITNLLISYAVTITIWLSLTGVLFNLILPIAAKLIFMITEPIVAYINGVIMYFGTLPMASITVPKETAFLILAVIVAVFWTLLYFNERKYNKTLNEKGIKTKKEIRNNKKHKGFKINV